MQNDGVLVHTYTLWLNLVYQMGYMISIVCVLLGLVALYSGVIYFRNMLAERGGNYSATGVVTRILMAVMLMNLYASINTVSETAFYETGIEYESTNPAAWNTNTRAQGQATATDALKALVFGMFGLFGYYAMVLGTFSLPKLDKYHKEHDGWTTARNIVLFWFGGVISINLELVMVAVQPYLPFLRTFN